MLVLVNLAHTLEACLTFSPAQVILGTVARSLAHDFSLTAHSAHMARTDFPMLGHWPLNGSDVAPTHRPCLGPLLLNCSDTPLLGHLSLSVGTCLGRALFDYSARTHASDSPRTAFVSVIVGTASTVSRHCSANKAVARSVSACIRQCPDMARQQGHGSVSVGMHPTVSGHGSANKAMARSVSAWVRHCPDIARPTGPCLGLCWDLARTIGPCLGHCRHMAKTVSGQSSDIHVSVSVGTCSDSVRTLLGQSGHVSVSVDTWLGQCPVTARSDRPCLGHCRHMAKTVSGQWSDNPAMSRSVSAHGFSVQIVLGHSGRVSVFVDTWLGQVSDTPAMARTLYGHWSDNPAMSRSSLAPCSDTVGQYSVTPVHGSDSGALFLGHGSNRPGFLGQCSTLGNRRHPN